MANSINEFLVKINDKKLVWRYQKFTWHGKSQTIKNLFFYGVLPRDCFETDFTHHESRQDWLTTDADELIYIYIYAT